MTSRNIDKAIKLITKFEGFSSTVYRCPAGVLTLGYGHTGGVKWGDTITKEHALELLKLDLQLIQDKVEEYDSIYHWTNNEYNALLSFGYNLGSGSIDQVTNYGNRNKEIIAKKMLLYCNANGEQLAGLVTRRKEEQKLFLTPDSSGINDNNIISLKREDNKK